MNRISIISSKFKKEARGRDISFLLKKMKKMREVLEWWKSNSKLNKYPFMKGVSSGAIHKVRLSAYSMIRALDEHIMPGLERLGNIIDGEDYFNLDDNEKKEAAKAYTSLRHNVDDWFNQFSSRYKEPWVELETEIQNTAKNKLSFKPSEYFENNILRYLRGLQSRLRQLEYFGRSRSY